MKRDLQEQMQWCLRAQWTMAGALLVLIFAFSYLGIRPATARLVAVNQRLIERQAELHTDLSRAATLASVQDQTEQLRQQVAVFDEKLPRQQNLPQLIGDVTQMSRRASLSKLDWRPEAALHRTEQLTEVPLDFTFQGDFLGVFNFLSQVEELPRLTRLQKLNMQAKDTMDGQVEVQLTMNIYFSEE